VFSYLCGIKVTDTQTGLRAIPTGLVKEMITVPGERFEYEMNMLIECGNKKTKIKEVLIDTIYLDNNQSSHFNPVLDSIKIYKTFMKYIISALTSFLLDIAFFAVIVFITREISPAYILISTIATRIVSSFYNYMVNKNIVFAGNQGRNTLVKYYTLAISIMLASGLLTTQLFNIFLII
jgi:putative flippase GtrA